MRIALFAYIKMICILVRVAYSRNEQCPMWFCMIASIVIITSVRSASCERLIWSPCISYLLSCGVGRGWGVTSRPWRQGSSIFIFLYMNDEPIERESKAAQNVTMCVIARLCAGRSNRAVQQIAEVEAKLLLWARGISIVGMQSPSCTRRQATIIDDLLLIIIIIRRFICEAWRKCCTTTYLFYELRDGLVLSGPNKQVLHERIINQRYFTARASVKVKQSRSSLRTVPNYYYIRCRERKLAST